MADPTSVFFLTLLCLCTVRGDHHDGNSNDDLDRRLGDLFWTVFVLAVFGFFIYLVCSYMPSDPPPPPSHCKREDSVINVRILNLPELLHSSGSQSNSSHGRAFPPQSGASA